MNQEREIVKYDNTLNSLRFKNFTQKDFDFFWAICSKVSEKGNIQVSLSFQELRELTNYKETDRNRMAADLDRMFQKLLRIVYRYEDDERIVMFNLFSKYEVSKTRDELQVRVIDEFLPLLNNLESRFTSFELREIVGLTSKHSKTLYRILKQWRTQGKTQIYTIEELKNYFDYSANTEFKFFQRDVLKVALEEINEKGYFKNLTMNINREEKKRGKPIKNIFFSFEKEEVKVPQFVKEKETKKKSKPAAEVKSTNKFNNFPQRKYSKEFLEELEKKLLAKHPKKE